MIIISKYDAERTVLAGEVANALGISEIPSKLMDLAIYTSELPEINGVDDYYKDVYNSRPERSLLSMPLIYSCENTLSVVLPNGHTALFPNSDIIKKELVNCGYLLCKEDEITPIMETNDLSPLEYKQRLNGYRERYTLSKELMEKIWFQEGDMRPEPYSDAYGDYAYDIFDHLEWYRDSMLGDGERDDIISSQDLTNPNVRKIIAIHTNGSLTRNVPTVDTLDQYILTCVNRGALNDREYYSAGGQFKYFSEIQETLRNNYEEHKRMYHTPFPTTTGLDENGDLVDDIPLDKKNK